VVYSSITEFIHFALNQEECRKRWQSAVLESQRLQTELEMTVKYISVLEGKLSHAQRMIDKEKQKRREVEFYISKLVRPLIRIMSNSTQFCRIFMC
jgi:predicted RNase H-like nuclease (RuvC/YqgF family)